MSKTCRRCGETKALVEFYEDARYRGGRTHQCKECVVEATRKSRGARGKKHENETGRRWRQRNPEKVKAKQQRKHERHPERFRAYERVKYAVETGKLIRPSECEVCGAKSSVQGHHDDYAKSLEVRWLCPQCHADVHAGIGL